MNLLKSFIVLLVLSSFFTCSNKKKILNADNETLMVLDTLSNLDNLFKKKVIRISDTTNSIDQLGIADIDDSGNIYSVGINQEIYKINQDGIIVKKINNLGRGPGEYTFISSIALDSKGNIFVADLGGLKVIKYDTLFNHLLDINCKSTYPISSLSFDNSGNLICYYTIDRDYSIYIYDSVSGELVKNFGISDKLAEKYSSFNNASNLIIENDTIYFCHPLKYIIYEYNLDRELRRITPNNTTHFTEIRKQSSNELSMTKREHSILTSLFRINNNFFVVGINSIIEDNKRIRAVNQYDIVNKNGLVINKEIPFNANLIMKQLKAGKLIAVEYHSDSSSKFIATDIILYDLINM